MTLAMLVLLHGITQECCFEIQTIEERRQELKNQMAASASQVLKNPEDNMSDLKPLLAMLHDCDPQVWGLF